MSFKTVNIIAKALKIFKKLKNITMKSRFLRF